MIVIRKVISVRPKLVYDANGTKRDGIVCKLKCGHERYEFKKERPPSKLVCYECESIIHGLETEILRIRNLSSDGVPENEKGWLNKLISEIEQNVKSWPVGLRFQLKKAEEA